MRVKCTCGSWHNISPTGLAIVVDAFQDGDMTSVISSVTDAPYPHPIEIVPRCLLRAFDDLARIAEFKRRYKGNVIAVDEVKK